MHMTHDNIYYDNDMVDDADGKLKADSYKDDYDDVNFD